MAKKKDLLIEIDKLNEKLSQRGSGKIRKTSYFLLLNSNSRPDGSTTEEDIENHLRDIIVFLGDNMDQVIEFNTSGHGWSSKYVESVDIKYAIERGSGRRKKDGTYPVGGGNIHAHVILTILHKSNITMTQEKLSDLLQPEFELYFGRRGFISRPRLISNNMVEEYMTKSKRYKEGHTWETV